MRVNSGLTQDINIENNINKNKIVEPTVPKMLRNHMLIPSPKAPPQGKYWQKENRKNNCQL